MHTLNTFTILLDLMKTIFKLYIFQKIIVSRNFFFKELYYKKLFILFWKTTDINS